MKLMVDKINRYDLYHKYLAMMPSASYHPRVVLELRNKGG
jgi:hypothetical protein